jgi:hypothetical protein
MLLVIHSSRHTLLLRYPKKSNYIHIIQVNMQAIKNHYCENYCIAETFLALC